MSCEIQLNGPCPPEGRCNPVTSMSDCGRSGATLSVDISWVPGEGGDLLEDGEVEERIEPEGGGGPKMQSLPLSQAQHPSDPSLDHDGVHFAGSVGNPLEIFRNSPGEDNELDAYSKKSPPDNGDANSSTILLNQRAIVDLIGSVSGLMNLIQPVGQTTLDASEKHRLEQITPPQNANGGMLWPSNTSSPRKNRRPKTVIGSNTATDNNPACGKSSFPGSIANKPPYSYGSSHPKKKLKGRWKSLQPGQIATLKGFQQNSTKRKMPRFKQQDVVDGDRGQIVSDNLTSQVNLGLIQDSSKSTLESTVRSVEDSFSSDNQKKFQHATSVSRSGSSAIDIIPEIESLLKLVSQNQGVDSPLSQMDPKTYESISDYIQSFLNCYPQSSEPVHSAVNHHQSRIIPAVAPSLDSATVLSSVCPLQPKKTKPHPPQNVPSSPQPLVNSTPSSSDSVADKLLSIFGFPSKSILFFLDPNSTDSTQSHLGSAPMADVDVANNSHYSSQRPSPTMSPSTQHQIPLGQSINAHHLACGTQKLLTTPNTQSRILVEHNNAPGLDTAAYPNQSKNKLSRQILKQGWRGSDSDQWKEQISDTGGELAGKKRPYSELKRNYKTGEPKLQSVTDQKKKRQLCKFAKSGSCLLGSKCSYSHDLNDQPCIFYHFKRHKGGCSAKDKCPYSHDAITGEQLAALFEEQKRWEQRESYKDQHKDKRIRTYSNDLLRLSDQLQKTNRDLLSSNQNNSSMHNNTFLTSQTQQIHSSNDQIPPNVAQNLQLRSFDVNKWPLHPNALQNLQGVSNFNMRDNASRSLQNSNEVPHLISQILMVPPQSQNPHNQDNNVFSCLDPRGDKNSGGNYNSNANTPRITTNANTILSRRDRTARII